MQAHTVNATMLVIALLRVITDMLLSCVMVCVTQRYQLLGPVAAACLTLICGRYAYELGAEPVLGGGFRKWVRRKGHRLSTNVSYCFIASALVLACNVNHTALNEPNLLHAMPM